jgi:hypothetical protein
MNVLSVPNKLQSPNLIILRVFHLEYRDEIFTIVISTLDCTLRLNFIDLG